VLPAVVWCSQSWLVDSWFFVCFAAVNKESSQQWGDWCMLCFTILVEAYKLTNSHMWSQHWTHLYLLKHCESVSHFLIWMLEDFITWINKAGQCSSICPSVHKDFFEFQQNCHVDRGRWVLHDGMPYDPIQGQGQGQGHGGLKVAKMADI